MKSTPKDPQPFKKCSCQKSWNIRDDFLSDPEINLIGYQVNFQELALGLFYFNHDRDNCHSTLAIYAEEFKNLFDGPVYTDRLTDTKECPGYCRHKKELNPCPQKCECAWVRDILHLIKNWPKKASSEKNMSASV